MAREKIDSTVFRLGNKVLDELKRVLKEKEIYGFDFCGTYDDLKRVHDKGTFPLMVDAYNDRRLVERALRSYIKYVEHYGKVPDADLPVEIF